MLDPSEDNVATLINLQSAKPFSITGVGQYVNAETPANQAQGAISVININ